MQPLCRIKAKAKIFEAGKDFFNQESWGSMGGLAV